MHLPNDYAVQCFGRSDLEYSNPNIVISDEGGFIRGEIR
jgi:hypothetical protein